MEAKADQVPARSHSRSSLITDLAYSPSSPHATAEWWAPAPISSHPSPFFVATVRTMLSVVALAAAAVVAVLECTVGGLH